MLCIKKEGLANCGPASSFYDGWTGGTIQLTPFPVYGTQLVSEAAADAICATTFGSCYRMAEHHDGGGGWQWRAKGTIFPLTTPGMSCPSSPTAPNVGNRFWVKVNDQTNGNCWGPQPPAMGTSLCPYKIC